MIRRFTPLVFLAILVWTALAQTESPKTVSQADANAHLVTSVDPITPPLAKAARIGGTVKIHIVISPDGNVATTKLISGHPMLAPAAMQAVKEWKYKPFVEGGTAISVATDVEINFQGGMPQSETEIRNKYFPLEEECRKLIHDGNFTEAEQKCRQAVELSNQLPKEVVLERSGALTQLAHSIYLQGRFSDSIPIYQDALDLDKGYRKSNDADLASDYANLGRAYAKAGDLSRADPLFATSVSTFEAAILNLPSMKENYTARLRRTLNEYAALKESENQSQAAEDLRNKAASLQ
jgi:TonB family protein